MLRDLLKPSLKVVFCGTAAGNRSARLGAYYAGRGNRFWAVLHRTGLTATQLSPQEYERLLEYGIGLTDLVKGRAGMDSGLTGEDFDRDTLRRNILHFQPKILAFNGRRAAQEFFRIKKVPYGFLTETIGSTRVCVLPSTSAAARGYWDEAPWYELARQARS